MTIATEPRTHPSDLSWKFYRLPIDLEIELGLRALCDMWLEWYFEFKDYAVLMRKLRGKHES